MSPLKAPTPPITPPKFNGFHADPKLLYSLIAAAIVTTILIAAWRALPKWLLLLVAIALLVAVGVAAVHIGGTTVGHR